MVYPTDFLLNLKRTVKLRSCFKFIPRQGLNMAGTYLLAMIILFLLSSTYKCNFLGADNKQ